MERPEARRRGRSVRDRHPSGIPTRTWSQRYRDLRSFRPWHLALCKGSWVTILVDELQVDGACCEAKTRGRGWCRDTLTRPAMISIYRASLLSNSRSVPREAFPTNIGRPFIIFSLLQHEHKTVLNFAMQRNSKCDYSESMQVLGSHQFLGRNLVKGGQGACRSSADARHPLDVAPLYAREEHDTTFFRTPSRACSAAKQDSTRPFNYGPVAP